MDEEEEPLSEAATNRLLRSRGLSHAKRQDFKPEVAKDPTPELPEAKDFLAEAGGALGRTLKGRSELLWKSKNSQVDMVEPAR